MDGKLGSVLRQGGRSANPECYTTTRVVEHRKSNDRRHEKNLCAKLDREPTDAAHEQIIVVMQCSVLQRSSSSPSYLPNNTNLLFLQILPTATFRFLLQN